MGPLCSGDILWYNETLLASYPLIDSYYRVYKKLYFIFTLYETFLQQWEVRDQGPRMDKSLPWSCLYWIFLAFRCLSEDWLSSRPTVKIPLNYFNKKGMYKSQNEGLLEFKMIYLPIIQRPIWMAVHWNQR